MGMAVAHKVGENTKSMILTRALAEMSRFAVKLGANPLTFLGLSVWVIYLQPVIVRSVETIKWVLLLAWVKR